MNNTKTVQLCVLCGEREATKGEGDHLPPQCIYPKPRPLGIPWNKVPACTPCNNAGSLDDEQFKLIIGISTGEFRENQQPVIDSLAATIAKNMRLARQVLTKYQRSYGYRFGNAVAEPLVAVPFDGESYRRVIQRIVRGLSWQRSGQILRLDAEIQVISAQLIDPELAEPIRFLLSRAERVELNDATFVYKYILEDDGSSFWGLQFFDKHFVFALVSPHAEP
ncbi:hypothetical protein [Pseudomonas sp. R3-18-08]|uniref:hypothetical protein n=1 Tax=Pseudomonas sp. R3-18-08 TaxID=1173283 RepID=UPI000F58B435|nr:hypothetical protein [Pseudomonas sp. R3-18-08]AZF17001.1 hypothetical protein C4J92_3533 [Pseudomonas sp. R3-18-08]